MTNKKVIKASQPQEYSRFIDEAGDMTFFKKGKIPAIPGENGVSQVFMLGMVKIKQPLEEAQKIITDFCLEIEASSYFNSIPSVAKRIKSGGYYPHASKDPAELRYKFLELLASGKLNFTAQIIVGRKDTTRFVNKHNRKEQEFYADLLSHLLKDKANYDKLVLTIAERGNSTRTSNLEAALIKAYERNKTRGGKDYRAKVEFNVQQYGTEPILAIIDYVLWTVQRIFEKGETRHYDLLKNDIRQIFDVYNLEKAGTENGWKNYYSPTNPLTTDNRITPTLQQGNVS